MRVCLVLHGFPPHERTGVEVYTAALAAGLARRGHAVEVLAPRRAPDLPELSLRREKRDGYGVNWLTTNAAPRDPGEALDRPGVARVFGAFLARERPEVVHFHHLVKLGVGLVHEARARGIPTLYTAHDYYPICHRYTLLRPDLTCCDTLADSMACARCDLALAFLDEKEGLGDYQMGALPEQLEPSEREALEGLVAGRPEAAGFTSEELDAAHDRRAELDRTRARAFDALDLLVSPSRFLADRLVQGGIPRERIEVLPNGIDTTGLSGLDPVGSGERVRFGFLGGLAKHKGAHVLIEAFRRLDEPAELSIWGYSSDEPYVESLRASASEAGALWHGSYERADLPSCLASVDVVVVPSIWVENHPIVIQEAFAAGRPVIASDLGALPESVRDGVDGLLVAPGDPETLARAMRRCVREDGMVAELARGITPVADMADHADAVAELYERVSGVEPAATPAMDGELASLQPFVTRFRERSRQPTRALLHSVLERLEGLRAGLGVEANPAEILGQALQTGSRTQDLLRDRRSESEWMRATLEARGEVQESDRRELGWMREIVSGKEEAVRSLIDEREWLQGVVAAKDDEIEQHQRNLAALERRVEDLCGRLGRTAEKLRATADLGLSALQAQEHLLGEEVRPLLEALERAAAKKIDAREAEVGHDAESPVLDTLVRGLELGARRLEALESELQWRRREMRVALEAADKRLGRILLGRTALGRTVARWRPSPGGTAGDGGGEDER
ncbi:MAG: glycosyltransferase [Planctomycetota bacterium]|nr:glycosyltransferase [Planctomycetota bacterium]